MPYCNDCGFQYAIGESRCRNCNAGFVTRPGPSVNAVESVATSSPVLKRFSAGVIDLAIALAIFGGLFFSRRMLLLVVFRRGFAILIPHIYLLVKDAVEGKSIGKLLTGVLVFDKTKQRPGGLLDSIIRNWYLAIPFVGPTLIAVVIGAQILSGARQRMGDAGAETTVITDAEFQKKT